MKKIKQIKTLDELNKVRLSAGEEIQFDMENFFQNLMTRPHGRIVYVGKKDNTHFVVAEDRLERSNLEFYSIDSNDGHCAGVLIQPNNKKYRYLLKIYEKNSSTV